MYRYAQGRTPQRQLSLRAFRRWFSKIDKKALTLFLGLLTLAGVFLGGIVLLGVFAWYSRDLPDPQQLIDRTVAQATKIYDRTGKHLLYEIYGDENRTIVHLQQGICDPQDPELTTDTEGIPLILSQAVIAAEDRSFCTHHGFSIKGLLRAVIFMGDRGGGSTLTQQLVKNALLSNEHRISRKIKELMVSLALERKYSKDQILQIYFNEIGYGSVYYGVQSAAENFYGKKVNELTLAEAATLAGIPQRPTTFINNPDLLKERRDWILSSMAELGYISEEAARAAQAESTPIHLKSDASFVAPHFVMWVRAMLEEQFGTSALETGGLKVITTLDYDKQVIAETAVKDGVEARGETYQFSNAGLLAQDPRTGEILAMVGSPDFSNDAIDGQVNVTLQKLQPGSSIKPIIYTAAFERGFTPNTVLWDVKTEFVTETAPYIPLNYDEKEHGLISLRDALQGSLNIPAVKVLALVGIDDAIAFAQRLGYTTFTDRSRIGLSMVLGGAEVTMLDHIGGYSTFASGGVRRHPQALLRVEDAQGNELFALKDKDTAGEKVLDEHITAMISNVLSDNAARAYVFGPNNYLVLSDRPVAAKTGTTNNYKDAWTVGYTPSLTAAVWVGNASGALMSKGADGSKIAAPIWNAFMKESLAGTPAEAFPDPQIPETGKSILDGKLQTTNVTIDKASGKLATDLTPESFKETLACGEFKTILAYIDPKNPLGDPPEHPEEHEQYAAWEHGIEDYIARHNAELKPGEAPLTTCTPPTEEDDVHTKRNEPMVKILSPQKGDTIGEVLTVSYQGEVRRTFQRTEFLLDGVYLGQSASLDSATLEIPSWVTQGEHTLSVRVYDDVDNVGEALVKISIERSSSFDGPRVTNPFPDQVIQRTDDFHAYTIAVELPHPEEYTSLTVRARHAQTGEEVILGSYISPNAILSVSWELPQNAGTYILSADAISSKNGEAVHAKPVAVTVRK